MADDLEYKAHLFIGPQNEKGVIAAVFVQPRNSRPLLAKILLSRPEGSLEQQFDLSRPENQ